MGVNGGVMSVTEQYKDIYKKTIKEDFDREIKVYEMETDENSYVPFSHNCETSCSGNCEHNCYKKLGELMRKNLIFYCYGENEIVKKINNHFFHDLSESISYAYQNRLPKREPNQDGLLSEVLFDLIIQNLFPDARKLAVRTILRQDDNNEIKGYDLTYFINDNGRVQIWLGQAKLGDKDYCKGGIDKDLKEKYDFIYMSKQIFFVADKQCELSSEGVALTDAINQINRINIKSDAERRAEAFQEYIKEESIEIFIPCLLSYGKKGVYKNIDDVERKIVKENESIKKYFSGKKYNFKGYIPKLIFFVFPLDDIEGLRSEEGFYEGLR